MSRGAELGRFEYFLISNSNPKASKYLVFISLFWSHNTCNVSVDVKASFLGNWNLLLYSLGENSWLLFSLTNPFPLPHFSRILLKKSQKHINSSPMLYIREKSSKESPFSESIPTVRRPEINYKKVCHFLVLKGP